MSRRLSPQAHAVFGVLAAEPACGVELMRACGLTSSTVYPLLRRMLAKGFVVSHVRHEGKAGRPRVYYWLTAAGRGYVEKQRVRSGVMSSKEA